MTRTDTERLLVGACKETEAKNTNNHPAARRGRNLNFPARARVRMMHSPNMEGRGDLPWIGALLARTEIRVTYVRTYGRTNATTYM